MKKIVLIFLAAAMVLSLAACGNSKKVKISSVDWTSYEAVMEFYNKHEFQATNNPDIKYFECEDGVVDISVNGNEVTAILSVNGTSTFYQFTDGALVNVNGEVVADTESKPESGENGAEGAAATSINGIAIALPEGYSLAEEYYVGNGTHEFVGRDSSGTIVFDIGYSHDTAKGAGFETIEAFRKAFDGELDVMRNQPSAEEMTVGKYEGVSVAGNGYAQLSYMANIALVSYENDEFEVFNILYDANCRAIIDSLLEGLKTAE